MGIKGLMSNRRRQPKAKKSEKYHRACKQEKKKRLPPKTLEVEDAHLFSKDKMKNKLRNPSNKVEISGKKRRRLTKRLNHQLREKAQIDAEPTSSKSEGPQTKDAEMQDGDDEQIETLAEIAEDMQTSGGRRAKKRGGRKHKKKAASASGGDATVPSASAGSKGADDGWEDVEMDADD